MVQEIMPTSTEPAHKTIAASRHKASSICKMHMGTLEAYKRQEKKEHLKLTVPAPILELRLDIRPVQLKFNRHDAQGRAIVTEIRTGEPLSPFWLSEASALELGPWESAAVVQRRHPR